GSVERRRLLSQAKDWIEAHLHRSFLIAELAGALHVSPRNLQYCFSAELGHSPLVEIRRVRFHRLRKELQSISHEQEPLDIVFRRCGLSDNPITWRHYRNWCGETPVQTRTRAKMQAS
ncbi:MAG: helix-turn-helix domain-containing protein, partial [Cyanobium sp.]